MNAEKRANSRGNSDENGRRAESQAPEKLLPTQQKPPLGASVGEIPRTRAAERRKPASSVDEILGDQLRDRVKAANSRLRAQMMGSILIELIPGGRKFLFDWSSDDFQMASSNAVQADCTMRLSEETLMRIALGELNPQVAMLSDKIRVSGKLSLAVYFFNLIVDSGDMGRDGAPSYGA